MFAEDAIANTFFGLEGCLRLIHRRFVGRGNFEIKPTVDHVEKVFREMPGYPDMLKECHAQRVCLVHPEPRGQQQWVPPVRADDFYENYGMAIYLAYYAVTGVVLPTCN